jgi:hypothetical protein
VPKGNSYKLTLLNLSSGSYFIIVESLDKTTGGKDVYSGSIRPVARRRAHKITMSAIKSMKHWQLNDEIPNRLPVLDRWLENAAQDLPLKGVTGLLIQYQLGNHVPQTQALIELGMAPGDIFWIDIPYTSTPAVREALRTMGIPAANFITSNFRLLDNYAQFQRLRVQSFLRRLFEKPSRHLLVLDDGSYVLEALACLQSRLQAISIVEQTTRGLIKIEESVALGFCSNGAAVCDALKRKLSTKFVFGTRDCCLVLGYGAIGQQVAFFLNEVQGIPRDRIHVNDPLSGRMESAAAVGFKKWSRDTLDIRFKLVIGCSGRDSFKLGDYVLLEDGAFLASATSGTVELSREHFIELTDSSPYDNIWIVRNDLDETNIHSNITLHFIDREAIFINGGFPVNFDGRINCVPAHYIQPTPTMMCAAAVQARSSSGKGLISFDPSFCSWLEGEFRRELADEAALIPNG